MNKDKLMQILDLSIQLQEIGYRQVNIRYNLTGGTLAIAISHDGDGFLDVFDCPFHRTIVIDNAAHEEDLDEILIFLKSCFINI